MDEIEDRSRTQKKDRDRSRTPEAIDKRKRKAEERLEAKFEKVFLAHQARATSALWAEVADPLAEAADELALSSIATSVNQELQVHYEAGMDNKNCKFTMKTRIARWPLDYTPTDLKVISLQNMLPHPDPRGFTNLWLSQCGKNLTEANDVLSYAETAKKVLLKRFFPRETNEDIHFLYAYTKDNGNEFHSGMMELLRGLYFQKPCSRGARPVFQRFILCDNNGRITGGNDRVTGANSSGVYIYWSCSREAWKIGIMNDRCAAFAICFDDQTMPDRVTNTWWLCDAYRRCR